MGKYRVVVVGLGPRGLIHIDGLCHNSDLFEIVGICDLIDQRLMDASVKFNIPQERCYLDAETMMVEQKPDVLVFATLPDVRTELVDLAVKYKVKGLMFEKPMAVSLPQAKDITQKCNANNIKTVICQQHKHLRSFEQLKSRIDSGELGDIIKIDVSCQAQASQLGTHYMDYIMWAAKCSEVESVVAHAHGSHMLNNNHPSPDYILGQVIFKNGIRAIFECGYFSARHADYYAPIEGGDFPIEYWTDDRLTVYGTLGYAYAECNGNWKVFSSKTEGKIVSGDYGDFFSKECYLAQDKYTKDFGMWLDGQTDFNPSDINISYAGFQAIEAMYYSAMTNTRVDFPLNKEQEDYDSVEDMKKKLTLTEFKHFTKNK